MECGTGKRKLAAIISTLNLLESSSSEEESDSDHEESVTVYLASKHLVKRRPQQRHRQRNYVENIASSFRLDEFKTFFRVSRVSVQTLEDYIGEVCIEKNIEGILCRQSTGGTEQIPLRQRLLMMLWFLSSLDKYSSVADRFGVSESTACHAIRNLLHFIHEWLLDRVVTWPQDDELQEIQDMYEELKNFPGVVGFIDGTHIRIRKPSVRGIDYYNRKDFYSVVLQAVVREDKRFTNVFVGFPGKVHDARVLRESPLYQSGQTLCRDGHLLGDSAYPNIPWLLTPFRDNGHLSAAQKRYNVTHSGMRSIVEQAFGLLKGRFVRLQHIDQRSIQTIVDTIVAACVLHNICILNHDDVEEVLAEEPVPQFHPNNEDYNAHDQDVAAIKRLNIARRL